MKCYTATKFFITFIRLVIIFRRRITNVITRIRGNFIMTKSLIGKQAVVLGGSMAGLAAAKALSNHYEKVIVIERDTPAAEAAPRKGTPQSHHAHALLKSGENALNKLFPDFT